MQLMKAGQTKNTNVNQCLLQDNKGFQKKLTCVFVLYGWPVGEGTDHFVHLAETEPRY